MSHTLLEVEQRLDNWPSDRPFCVEEVLKEFPDLRGNKDANAILLLEEYVRLLERGIRTMPSEFLETRTATSSLNRMLQNVADFHSRTGVLRTDPGEVPDFPSVGDCVCGYRLLLPLGRGAFSRVFLAAEEKVGDRQVVVKMTSLTRHESSVNRESCILGQLSHPRLPRILTRVDDNERQLSLTSMEFTGTRTLVDLLNEMDEVNEKHRINTAVRVVTQIADGLGYAHAQGILHLDVKPANIVIDDDGNCLLVDFNLSAPVVDCKSIGFRGTVAYAAPEALQVLSRTQDSRSTIESSTDTYSLGLVLYELLVGMLPWNSGKRSCVEEQLKKMRAELVLPSEINPYVPKDLDEIVARSLEWDPNRRFETGSSFHRALIQLTKSQSRSSWTNRVPIAISVAIVGTGIIFTDAIGTQSDHTFSQQGGVELVRAPERRKAVTSQIVPALFADLAAIPKSDLRCIKEQLTIANVDPSTVQIANGFLSLLLDENNAAVDALQPITRSHDAYHPNVDFAIAYAMFQQGKLNGAAHFLDRLLNETPDQAAAAFLRSLVEVDLARKLNREPNLAFFNMFATTERGTTPKLREIAILYAHGRLMPNAYRERASVLGLHAPPSPDESSQIALERADIPFCGDIPPTVLAALEIATLHCE